MALQDKYIPMGLGLVAKKKRIIQSGIQYTHLFPRPLRTDPTTDVPVDTITAVHMAKQIVLKTLADTIKIAPLLKANDLNKTAQKIWNFFYTHYLYKIDKTGVEQFRRPARAWSDRAIGIDCDCFAISVSSVLMNLGIRHFLRIVKMYSNIFYQHIYVVVPKTKASNLNNRSEYYVVDPVVDAYDFEPNGVTFKTDIEMIPVQYLNGVDEPYTPLGTEFNGLGENISGIDGEGLHQDYLGRLRQHLINTRNAVSNSPQRVSAFYDPNKLVANIDGLLGVWNDEQKRDAELERLSGLEEEMLQAHLQGMGDMLHGSDEELFGLMNISDSDLQGIDGLGKKDKARKVVTGTAKKIKKAGVFTAIKKGGKIVKASTKKFGTKAKVITKKVGKGIVKNNPVVLAGRGSFLVAMKTNFGRLASRSYWGYFSQSEATKNGVSASYYAKSKQALNALEKTFVGKLKGQSSALKKAIITGLASRKARQFAQKGKLSGIGFLVNGLETLSGLGVIEAATITAGLSFLTPILTFFAQLFKNKSGKEEIANGSERDAKDLDKENLNDGGGTVNTPVPKDIETKPDSSKNSDSETPTAKASAVIEKEDTHAAENYDKQVKNTPKTASVEDTKRDENIQDAEDKNPDAENKKGLPELSNTNLVVAGVGLLAVAGIALAVSHTKKEKPSVNGLGNHTAKCSKAGSVLRTSENTSLKTVAAKALNTCKIIKNVKL